MNTLLIILLLIAVAALIIGLIRPSLLKQTSRTRVGIIGGIAIILLFALVGITSKSAPTPTAATSTAPVQQTLAQKIAAYAPQIYGNGISYEGTTNDNTGLSITLDVSNIVGPATFRNNTGLLASKIFQDAFAANPDAPEINILFAGQKVDQYGNTATGTLMAYYMTQPTFAKFNWPNFDGTTLCDVLQQAGNTENANTPNSTYTDGCTIFVSDLQ